MREKGLLLTEESRELTIKQGRKPEMENHFEAIVMKSRSGKNQQMLNLGGILMSSRIFGLSSQGYGFSSGHVWMWELDCEESWVPKNWCFWIVVLEKTLESPLDCKEIQPVHPKGDQAWLFIGRTDAEAEAPILWPPHAKSWLIGKDPDAGGIGGRRRRGRQRMRWLDGITDSMDMSLCKL